MKEAATLTRSGARSDMSLDQAVAIARESAPGVGLVLVLGFLAMLVAQAVTGLDPLVAAVILGMAVRQLVGSREAFFFKLVPGIIVAQAVLVPVGITLYGKNFDLNALVGSHPLVILQVTSIAVSTFAAMYVIGKRLGLKDHVVYMLGFGSAVCGASAIAVTAPVTECEPEDTAAGLVNNTIAVVLCLAGVAWFLRPLMGDMQYAALAGALLHQTGFVKMALAGAARQVVTFGLAVKSLRIALLTISIPVVSYLVRRRFYLPWFLITFVLAGVLFSYVSIPQGASDIVVNIYNLCFASALASVGLNADVRRVGRNLFKPLVLILVVFALDLGLFMLTAQFITY
jgi:uncharacterized integral membrane protein (TIGR00698 family)